MGHDDGYSFDDPRRRMDRALSIFERLLPPAAEPSRADDGTSEPSEGPIRMAQVRSVIAGSFDVYSRLMAQSLDLYEDLVQQALGSPTGSQSDESLQLVGAAGGLAESALWIHNTTNDDADLLRAWMTTLTAHDGAEIGQCCGVVTPGGLEVPGGISREALLTVTIPPGVRAGCYYGYVLVEGLPSVCMSVRLVVTA